MAHQGMCKLAKLKRLAKRNDAIATVESTVTEEELSARERDYAELTPEQFARRYRGALYQPVTLHYDGIPHKIQVNFCTNPFCKWFGLQQVRFEGVKHKPYRYKIEGRSVDRHSIRCNPDPLKRPGMTLDCFASATCPDMTPGASRSFSCR